MSEIKEVKLLVTWEDGDRLHGTKPFIIDKNIFYKMLADAKYSLEQCLNDPTESKITIDFSKDVDPDQYYKNKRDSYDILRSEKNLAIQIINFLNSFR